MKCRNCQIELKNNFGGNCSDCWFNTKLDLMVASSDLPIKRGWEDYINGWVIAPSYASWTSKVMKWPAPFMVDNGAWTDHLNNVEKTPIELIDRTLKLANKVIENGGQVKFIVLPDKVGCWKTTYSHIIQSIKEINNIDFPLALAIQDGFTEQDIDHILDQIEISWFFIGGSSFKFKKDAVRSLKKYGIPIHVGKVHRVEQMCYFVNEELVLSIDTSTYSRPQSKERIKNLNTRLELFHAYKKGKQMKII